MRFNYDIETDALYIAFNDLPGIDSQEIAPDYIIDTDEAGNIIGLEILNVKRKIDFKDMKFNNIPLQNISFVNQPVLS